MITVEFITVLFYEVDEQLRTIPKHPEAHLWPSEVVTLGLLHETIASLPGFGMAPEGHLSYSSGPNIRARRTKPCSVQVRIDPIPPKGLPRLQTCHRQRSSLPVAPTSAKPVRVAVTRHTGISSPSGRCTT